MTGLSCLVFVLFNMSRMYYNVLYIQYGLLCDGYIYMYMYTFTHISVIKNFFLNLSTI